MARNQGSQLLGVGGSAESVARRVAFWRIAVACSTVRSGGSITWGPSGIARRNVCNAAQSSRMGFSSKLGECPAARRLPWRA